MEGKLVEDDEQANDDLDIGYNNINIQLNLPDLDVLSQPQFLLLSAFLIFFSNFSWFRYDYYIYSR